MPIHSEEKDASLLPKDRLEAFSDGVFAILLTLLVLELRVPEIADHSSMAEYFTAMQPLIPKLISFLLSFFIIAIHWISHHYFFRHIRHTPIGLIWLNTIYLLWICLLPFPTALLGDHPTDQFPILLYAIDSLFAALNFYAMRSYACRHNLIAAGPDVIKALGPTHSIPAIAIFVASIVLSFVNVYLSLLCFLIMPFLYFVPTVIRSRK